MTSLAAEAKTTSTSIDEFKAAFAGLVEEHILEDENVNQIPQDLKEWVRELCMYNVPHGKLNRGVTTLQVAKSLGGDAEKAAILGWCVEWLQAFFLVADDVMDESVTRRGQPCWYKKRGVGLLAINDSFILEAVVYRMLRKHFRGDACYVRLLELFLDVSHKTELGQMADMLAEQSMDLRQGGEDAEGEDKQAPVMNLDLFTADRHAMIVKYKTAFYTFYLPVALGMVVSGMDDDASYEAVQQICVHMGEYFQVQDDVLDAFADPEVLGKVGTDIQDGKCSWLVVQALQVATPDQRAVLQDSYGRNTAECIAAVKVVYADMDLQGVYDRYEAKAYDDLCAEIAREGVLPVNLQTPLLGLLNKIHKRKR